MQHEPIRTLFSRNHDTIFPKLGVFLAGATPSEENLKTGWRRKVIQKLLEDKRLNPSMIVVSPEPETGKWADIDNKNPKTELEAVRDKQITWELQYLQLCDITAFWLPAYWTKEKSGIFDANIAPTSRLEFGYFLQEYVKNPIKRKFIVGSPEDADSIKWAKKIADIHGIKWHFLKTEDKSRLVADSFVEEIATALIGGKWEY
ncbi:nucleoside 2-deoxyribosyltransferase domain-containing protein (plasmid) [Bernardetia sp. Wsw4-3y2]|uniref:nucleoside 2-deoxyribosyltransferase domain-containing protein n=1 Tax=unclassified Bernardetia TaxID=2647129 RepID=UPI0030CD9D4A